MKIIKFLHAANLQLHLPVTCWTVPREYFAEHSADGTTFTFCGDSSFSPSSSSNLSVSSSNPASISANPQTDSALTARSNMPASTEKENFSASNSSRTNPHAETASDAPSSNSEAVPNAVENALSDADERGKRVSSTQDFSTGSQTSAKSVSQSPDMENPSSRSSSSETPPVLLSSHPSFAEPSQTAEIPCADVSMSIPFDQFSAWFQGSFPDLPATLHEECLNAVWKSAERVFSLAIEQNVDFLLLTGDVIQPDLTGARGLVFLTEQFRRLQARGIAVYWKLEKSLENWMLPDFHFPENVFLFPSSKPHIKKFRLPDSAKNIFIASWNSLNPDFSHYDFSNLPNETLPFLQTIALCPNEKIFTNRGHVRNASLLRTIPSAKTAADSLTPSLDSATETESPSSLTRLLSHGEVQSLPSSNSNAESAPFNSEFASSNSHFDSSNSRSDSSNSRSDTSLRSGTANANSNLKAPAALGSKASEIPLSTPQTFQFPPTEAAFPVEAAYTALTSAISRTTQKLETPSGKHFILHSPGPNQYHSPDFALAHGQKQSAGTTLVQLDLDGEVPLSLQFFPTEILSWSFLEKRIPGNVSASEDLRNWLKQILKEEFSLPNFAESISRKNSTPQSSRSHRSQTQAAADGESAKTVSPSSSSPNSLGSSHASSPANELSTAPQDLASARRTLVFWRLTTSNAKQSELLRTILEEGLSPSEMSVGSLPSTLLSELRELGETLPLRPWTVTLQPERKGLLPAAWSQSETMLGDFLRLVQFHLANPEEEMKNPDFAQHSLNLKEMLSDEQMQSILAELTEMGQMEKNAVLEFASILGASALAKVQEGPKK